MKLNHDCIRDLLLYLEKNSSYNNKIIADKISLKNYSTEELIYTTEKLFEANYLNCKISGYYQNSYPSIKIESISYEGHKFLDNIRDNIVWSHTKTILSKFSSTSIGIVSDIASQVISNIISKTLNVN